MLATTTPDDMIRPLADRLGFDDVVATRYGVDGDGRYDGTIDGEFVWGKGKLRGGAGLGRRAGGVDLDESWAYSDSYYDDPLLGAVGHPVAVNPDPRLWRWPRCAAGRSCTSTCRPACPSPPARHRAPAA